MDEFELVRRYFSTLTPPREDVALGIGDDAAVLSVPNGQELVVTADTLIAGRHFPENTAADAVGAKALAVNLSDLAAMGAQPRWALLSLTLPEADEDWLQGFAAGLEAMADAHDVALVGGDTTRGPLSITITALGLVPRGAAITRAGARVGDWVCVTGTLGDAALALAQLGTREIASLRERLDRPTPRIAEGIALRGFATAAIDISDGLLGDLGHIAGESGVGAVIRADRLPMSPAFERLSPSDSRLRLQLAGGDDYELCVCLPPEALEEARRRLKIPLTHVGEMTTGAGVHVLDGRGRPIAIDFHSWRHFE